MNDKEEKYFDESKTEAQSILNDPAKTKELLHKVMRKSDDNEGIFASILEELRTLVRLVKSWKSGDYTDVSKKSVILVAGALVYLINPLDIIPDFTPILGLMDDVTILGFVIKSVRSEITKFQNWEEGETVIVEAEEVA